MDKISVDAFVYTVVVGGLYIANSSITSLSVFAHLTSIVPDTDSLPMVDDEPYSVVISGLMKL